jgi:hypothetical protein
MVTIEVNGRKVEAETEKEAKKALAKLMREDKKERAARNADYQQAQLKAQAAAYRVLARKATGERFPCGWTFYTPDDKFSSGLFQRVECEAHERKVKLNTEARYGVEYDHYGYHFLGAVCNGAGFAWLVVIQDLDRERPPEVLAIGATEHGFTLAECPGIGIDDFRQAKDETSLAVAAAS